MNYVGRFWYLLKVSYWLRISDLGSVLYGVGIQISRRANNNAGKALEVLKNDPY